MDKKIVIDGQEIEAVVFDMDGLLFDSERVVQRSWTLASKELDLPDVGEHIYGVIGFNAKRRAEYFYRNLGGDFPLDQFNAISREKFQEIEESEGIDTKPGVKELLKYLKERGVKIALATSSRRAYAERLLDAAGIDSYFDDQVCGDMVVNAKPDPEIYLKACAAIQSDPLSSIALEDSPAGIEAAHRAGLLPVMIPDLVAPVPEIEGLCYRMEKSLLDVLAWLKEN